jgi:hypothetical protein
MSDQIARTERRRSAANEARMYARDERSCASGAWKGRCGHHHVSGAWTCLGVMQQTALRAAWIGRYWSWRIVHGCLARPPRPATARPWPMVAGRDASRHGSRARGASRLTLRVFPDRAGRHFALLSKVVHNGASAHRRWWISALTHGALGADTARPCTTRCPTWCRAEAKYGNAAGMMRREIRARRPSWRRKTETPRVRGTFQRRERLWPGTRVRDDDREPATRRVASGAFPCPEREQVRRGVSGA